MLNSTHVASLIVALALGWSVGRAQDAAPESGSEATEVPVGLQYLAHYHAGKIEEMRPFFDEASVFEDPTAESMGSVFRLTGGDQIVQQLTAIFKVQNPQYEAAFEFQSGRFAVSTGTFSYGVPGSAVGVDEESVRLELQVASIVEFEGDKVVRHADYGDYVGMMERVKKK